MGRKLYALILLVGVIAFMVLLYLYFFVYYTATLEIDSNVTDYRVELFSKSTAQKWQHNCPEMNCIIPDVSPFEYNVNISKEWYESFVMNIDVAPRRRETLFIELQEKVILTSASLVERDETPREQIERIREENRSLIRFKIQDGTSVRFEQKEDTIEMLYKTWDTEKNIASFPALSEEEIDASPISSSNDIFLALWEKYYIFRSEWAKLLELDFSIEILYIKAGKKRGEYIIITEKGAFLYDSTSQSSTFQYLFRDYVYDKDDILIGVIYADEEQKKENFGLKEQWNLIIKYSPRDKIREVLYNTSENIERIEKRNEAVILTINGSEFQLENY